jgi:metal-responsive CopG/Arc/MetJ family transcriptional regulator
MGSAKIMISVPEEMLSELDHKAREDHRSRSEFIREAVRHFLELKKTPDVPGRNQRIREAVSVQDALAQEDSSKDWNGTEEIRKWRANHSQ